jgi:4-hydroxy-tetrahydrodipicolinate synthase
MLEGILPVLPTPFQRDGSIDPAAMVRVVDFALAAGVHGLVFPGFASEVDELAGAERRELLAVVVERAQGRVPVVAGASSASVADAMARCREALELGVRSVMIQAPKSVGRDAAEVGAFYAAIAQQVPEVEIVLQNAPAPRGSDLAPQTILEIARGNPAIRYIKEETLPSGPAISTLLAGRGELASHVQGVIGGGGARHIIDELNRGACGAMPAAEIADIHVALFEAYRSGQVERARELYQRSLPLLVMQALSRMRFTKHVLTRRGVLHNNVVRADIPPLDAHDRAEIDAWLDDVAEFFVTAPLTTKGPA